MKTAEEWHHSKDYVKYHLLNKPCSCISCSNVRQIQLDAWKQGMEDASKIISCNTALKLLGELIIRTANDRTQI